MSQSSTRHRGLPIELLELILCHLSEDLAAIKECRLVCRAWLPDATRALFHSVKVQEYSDYKRILATLTTTPEIRSCIKHLDITIYNDYQWVQRTTNEDVSSFLGAYAPESLESLRVEIYELEYESDTGSPAYFIWSEPS